MDAELMFVVGTVLCGFSVPSILSAMADSRPPRAAAIILLIGGVLVVVAIGQRPGGFAINDIPNVFFRVIGRYLY